ncbi:Glycosyl transferases group 1 family protein [Alteromonas sp. 38]|uniref:glycosyltransferase n=1 Tax=unclassified Alteromonas TaxID=2614992 RepID=UPI0012F3CA92|nr:MULTISPECIES: glycosyltransferase [unclassified Alteromonas]CAD5280420.1 Glycosyl transferases group 1 family protein [Alteromonas sp. 154]VXB80381.1 Glycosyl transferases group 1 family protein [Alteromonas sp. 38]
MENQKISVLYFLNRFPLPSETFVIDQICGLMDRGIEISIISLIKGDYENMHEKVIEYGLDKKTIYLSEQTKAKFTSRITSLGSSLFNPKIFRLLNYFKYGSVAKNLLLPLLEKKKEKSEFDYIIAHFGTAGVTAMKIMDAGVLQGKLIPVFHGADISKKKNLEAYQADYRKLFSKSFALFPISDLWKRKLIELGADKSKTMVNRMGIDVVRFTFVDSAPSESDFFNIVSVARMVEKKGIDDAIKAMSLLKLHTNIPFTYDLVGGGPLFEEMKELASELGLSNTIKFHGVQTQSRVKELLSNANVFLLPSKTASDGDMEGIPVSLMESMSSGIVTVSTFHSGIPELITHEVEGFLVPENSPEDIAQQLSRIINDEFDLSQIRLNALAKVSGEFNQKNAYDQMYNFLKENLDLSQPSIENFK